MFKKIKGYSRGMKQRLGIAQALINNLSLITQEILLMRRVKKEWSQIIFRFILRGSGAN